MADVFDYMKKLQGDIFKTFDMAFSSEYKKPMTDISQNLKFVIVKYLNKD